MKRYAEQQEEIAKSEDLIRRFRYKATKAAMVQERIKKLEKMERIEIPESLKKISITFPPPPHSGRIALTLDGISKSYGSRRVLSDVELLLESAERLVVVGRNGAGKSTLLRIIAGRDRDFAGKVNYGAGIAAGYFSQDAAETMTGSEQVIDFMEAEAPTALIPRVRDMLGAFLFRGDDVHKPISVLSGGEKSRLALLRMLLKPMNLLILDEPTNHLDLQSKDILLDTLKAFTGTIIFVSHDRAFMEALSTKTLELSVAKVPRGKGVQSVHRLFYGNYAYYLDRLEREAAEAAAEAVPGTVTEQTAGGKTGAPETVPDTEAPGSFGVSTKSNPEVILIKKSRDADASGSINGGTQSAGTAPGSAASSPGGTALSREAAKQRQTLVRRLERQEAEILKELEALDAEKKRLEAEISRPEVYSNGEKAKAVQAKLNEAAAAAEAKTREWEAKAEELEKAR
jgi:ATP-binding cassette subfamily F protein 3